MSRAKKEIKVREEKPAQPELCDLRKAVSVFKLNNPEKAVHLQNLEIIKLYAEKHIPSLMASQEAWNEVLMKF